ncbi:Myb-like DNA-binding domain protein [Aspergillus novofumigatus IBT 16806]|uniref:Myb-like domain-containing protein n=1 Tax=Aspergillus novofumigatus (strain IBT 16806) TaxID=1392255 RepID=A0A2I1C094_ASPN1|nr:uncharacterized protein P174DRAFT_514999 [Aspergillus novofumigatus IBT 16806]PKX91031.1 hypothetical protein P174DRAFT_514999 [Aspergillus novofumigatus IBT 16806]
MERPQKRPRLSLGGHGEDPDDIDLQEARAQNDLRLKSIFERIFEKYGKDFTEIGDEIDLQTGKIVVNNGHLQRMSGEDDIGEEDDEAGWLFKEDLPTSTVQISKATLAGSVHDSEAETGTGGDDTKEGEQLQRPLTSPQPLPALRLGRAYDEKQPPETAEADSDDDSKSVDSLLDCALIVPNDSDKPDSQALPLENEAFPAKANTTADTPIQSPQTRGDKANEPVESIWRVPEIKGEFSTPIFYRSRRKLPLTAVRSASPPRAGSLWALPGQSRRNTDGRKEKSRKKKLGVSQRKHKHQSSPVLHDWSFAETPDGSESDDPLQEDYQPSPTPKNPIHIRGKNHVEITPSRTKDERRPLLPQLNPDCQTTMNALRGGTEPKIASSAASQLQPEAVEKHADQCLSVDTPVSAAEQHADPVIPQASTPTRAKRTLMTPDEAKLIVRMRQIEGKKWKEVQEHLPQRKLISLIQWNQTHWTERHDKPPRVSKPWSKEEADKLQTFKDQQGLTWPHIRAALPGRSHAEIEFALLRLWAELDDGSKETREQDDREKEKESV